MTPKARVLGELDTEHFRPLSVREEMRRNLIRKLRAREKLFPGIVGFDETVIPQIVNALLAHHDIIFLGLRGQAKTRLARMLVDFLDPEVPMIAGTALREHPLAPVTEGARRQVEEAGGDLPLEWLSREERYGEKLATPDVTMADLIGDVDPLKAAHLKLDLSNPEVMHYGIIPRTNRGIFAINELPDLAPRIQVGMLNLLEERDFQIRGFPVRIPMDVLTVFTANPEDYTNRGSIITPLKDRIASQILTHYPRSLEDAKTVTEDQAWLERGPELPEVLVPSFIADVVEEIGFQGRSSEYIDQSSGVSARLAIAARELLTSQVEKRLLENPEDAPVARLVDLSQVVPAVTGKVELVYEGEQEGSTAVSRHLIGNASRAVFDRYFPDVIKEGSEPQLKSDRYKPVLDWFTKNDLDLSDRMDDAAYKESLGGVPGLRELAQEFLPSEDDLLTAVAMELILEGLHQHSLLAKEDAATGVSYSDMLGIMLEGLK